MEDIVVIESKDYSQVVFDDIKDCYLENNDLECYFALNELLKVDQSDFIGIYKVGFTNTKDYYAYHNVCLNAIDEENKGKIVLPANKIPKDDGEFYQFVYVSNNRHIRGASIPFQFKKSYISDYIQVDEQETVIIKTKEAELSETISQIKAKCVNLEEANQTYERLIKENEDLIKILKDDVNSIKLRCLQLSMENEKLNMTLKTKSDCLKDVNNTMIELTNENNKIKEKYEHAFNENRTLIDHLQRRVNQVELLKNEYESIKSRKEELEIILNLKDDELKQLQKEKDELNRVSEDIQQINEEIKNVEKQVDERIHELNKIKCDLKQNETLVSDQTKTIQGILNEKDTLNGIIQTLTLEKNELESAHGIVVQELLMCKDKLLAEETTKDLLKMQLNAVTNELESVNSKMKMDNEKIDEFKNENEKLINEINRIKIDYSTRLEQSNGTYFALNLANNHLENKIKLNEEKHKLEMEKIKEENENLKQRIRAGALEFANLNKKYLKLKTYVFTNKMETLTKRKESVDSMPEEEATNCHDHEITATAAENINNHHNFSDFSDATLVDCFLNSTKTIQITECSTIFNNNNYETTIPEDDCIKVVNNNNNTNESTIRSDEIENQRNNIFEYIDYPSSPMSVENIESNSSKNSNLTENNNNNNNSNNNNNNTELKNCDICGYIFPTDLDMFIYEEHMANHYGPTCPICFLTFRKGYPQSDYENHVNSHFSN